MGTVEAMTMVFLPVKVKICKKEVVRKTLYSHKLRPQPLTILFLFDWFAFKIKAWRNQHFRSDKWPSGFRLFILVYFTWSFLKANNVFTVLLTLQEAMGFHSEHTQTLNCRDNDFPGFIVTRNSPSCSTSCGPGFEKNIKCLFTLTQSLQKCSLNTCHSPNYR